MRAEGRRMRDSANWMLSRKETPAVSALPPGSATWLGEGQDSGSQWGWGGWERGHWGSVLVPSGFRGLGDPACASHWA